MVPLPIGNCFVNSPTLSCEKLKHWTPISIEEEELLLEEQEPEVSSSEEKQNHEREGPPNRDRC
jgi:hypothetical protein